MSDDVNLKGSHRSSQTCIGCAIYELEDVHHIVMQFPSTQALREFVF